MCVRSQMSIACSFLETQAYKYIQRPALPVELTEGGMEAQAKGSRVVSGHPIGIGGRSRPSYFPPFPQVCPATCCLLSFNVLFSSKELLLRSVSQFGMFALS